MKRMEKEKHQEYNKAAPIEKKEGIYYVAYICSWLCVFCRDYDDPGKMRNPPDRFQCGNGGADGGDSFIFLADGLDRWFRKPDPCDQRINNGVFSTLRSGDRCVLAMLFPRPAAGRY